MIEKGASDQEIFDFMSDRYGDFVLYNPPVKPRTLLLWIGPFVLLIGGVMLAILLVRKRSKSVVDSDLNDQDKQRLKDLLNEENKK
jgi:cytochrome c-type biogenesis protein CcmH